MPTPAAPTRRKRGSNTFEPASPGRSNRSDCCRLSSWSNEENHEIHETYESGILRVVRGFGGSQPISRPRIGGSLHKLRLRPSGARFASNGCQRVSRKEGP